MNTNTEANPDQSATPARQLSTRNSPLTTSHSPLSTRLSRPRSTIARLPHKVREMLNHALREGEPYVVISARISKLVDRTHPYISADMLSRWLRTGYRDWLRQRTHLENTIAQTDAALSRLSRFHQENGASLPDLADTLLAAILQTILQDFDPASIKTLLAEKPAEFFRLVTCFNAHIAARSRDKNAEVARARCQVEMAEKAQSSRTTPDTAKEIWEKQLVSQVLGGPMERLGRAFNIPWPGKTSAGQAPSTPEPGASSRCKTAAKKPHATPKPPPTDPIPTEAPPAPTEDPTLNPPAPDLG